MTGSSLRDKRDQYEAELEEAEAARDRQVIARETVSEVLSESRGPNRPKNVQVSWGTEPIEPKPAAPGTVPRSVGPVRREGLDMTPLSPGYQRIRHVLSDRERSGERPEIYRRLADARALELARATSCSRKVHVTRLAPLLWRGRSRASSVVCAGRRRPGRTHQNGSSCP